MNPAPETREAAPQQGKAAPFTKSQAQSSNSNDRLPRQRLAELPLFLRDLNASPAGESEHEDRLLRFFGLAYSATWSQCQLIRIPVGCWGETNTRQLVHIFDPRNTGPIKGGFNL